MRHELRYVFDENLSVNSDTGKAQAVEHLNKMAEPQAWIHDQITFDKELAEAGKISDRERLRRHTRWEVLLGAVRDAA